MGRGFGRREAGQGNHGIITSERKDAFWQNQGHWGAIGLGFNDFMLSSA
jgi:hypothetical protein